MLPLHIINTFLSHPECFGQGSILLHYYIPRVTSLKLLQTYEQWGSSSRQALKCQQKSKSNVLPPLEMENPSQFPPESSTSMCTSIVIFMWKRLFIPNHGVPTSLCWWNRNRGECCQRLLPEETWKPHRASSKLCADDPLPGKAPRWLPFQRFFAGSGSDHEPFPPMGPDGQLERHNPRPPVGGQWLLGRIGPKNGRKKMWANEADISGQALVAINQVRNYIIPHTLYIYLIFV